MGFLVEKKQGFYWKSQRDPDNAMTAFVNQSGGLTVAIDDKDADGFKVETIAYLDREAAERLRDHLVAELQKNPN